TPAFSPGPTSTHGASLGSRRKCRRDDLYEQCSLHMTEYMASSRWLGDRPRMASMRASSSSVKPSARCTSGAGVAVVIGPPSLTPPTVSLLVRALRDADVGGR